MQLELPGGEIGRVGSEKELQDPDVADLVELFGGLPAPGVKGRQAGRGEAVGAPPPAALLALLIEQARLGQPGALRVELGVGDRPEVGCADLGHLLDLIWSRGLRDRFGLARKICKDLESHPRLDHAGRHPAGEGGTPRRNFVPNFVPNSTELRGRNRARSNSSDRNELPGHFPAELIIRRSKVRVLPGP